MDDYDNDNPIPNMDNHYDTLMQFLTESDDMRKTATGSLKQGFFAGGGAVVGGILLGPVGGLVGGITGSLVGYFQAPDYNGMVQHITGLEDQRKQQLLRSVRLCLVQAGANARNFESPDAFRSALLQFAAQRQVRDQIWKACLEALDTTDNQQQQME
jgi:hypothetical protein